VRELGQGGMAVVYLAERADGHYSQRVALKILRFGLEGSQAQFHFAQERQILASLDHQSIADISMTRSTNPGRLRRSLRDDLDAILLKGKGRRAA
jgi:serine/threonine-protein kinase